MSVDRTQIYDSHFLKHHSCRNHKGFKAVLCPSDLAYDTVTVGLVFDLVIYALFKSEVSGRCSDGIKILGNTAYILGYGHVVVVKNDDKIRIESSGIIESFVCHSSGKRSVSDNRNDGFIASSHITRAYHTETCRD